MVKMIRDNSPGIAVIVGIRGVFFIIEILYDPWNLILDIGNL
jgi:hypothetical protein